MYDLDKYNGPGANEEMEEHRRVEAQKDLEEAERALEDAEALGDELAIVRAETAINDAKRRLGIETGEAEEESEAA